MLHSYQATPPPECCRHAVVHARVRCADRPGAGALSSVSENVFAASLLLSPSSAELSAQARRVQGARQDRANTGQGEGTVDRKRGLSGRGASRVCR